jgi:hypothetical protein
MATWTTLSVAKQHLCSYQWMAEIIGSAVASEAVSRVSSFLSGDKTGHDHESDKDKTGCLEMAVLKEDPQRCCRLGRSPLGCLVCRIRLSGSEWLLAFPPDESQSKQIYRFEPRFRWLLTSPYVMQSKQVAHLPVPRSFIYSAFGLQLA